jgi:beta-glucosidase
LKGFQKVFLKAGEKRTVEIIIKAKDLGFYNAANQYVVEDGEFGLTVGTSSDDERLKDTFAVVK